MSTDHAAGRISTVSYANGVVGTYAYDVYGRESGVVYTQGVTVLGADAVTRDLSGRIIDRSVDGVDANPSGANYVYDGAGRLVEWSERDPSSGDVHSGTYGFGAAGSGCTAAHAGRNSNRTTASRSLNGGSAAVTSYCYDYADRITSVSTPSGAANPYASGFDYDDHGNTVRVGGTAHVYDGADRHMGSGPVGGVGSALLMVGDHTSLSNRDTWLRDRLIDVGYAVTLISDDDVVASSPDGHRVVVISESVGGAAGTAAALAIKDTPVGIVSSESYVFDELGMTGIGSNQGSEAAQMVVQITAAGAVHDLGGGFGAGALVTSPLALVYGWGKPNANAVVAATVPGDASKATIFGYDTGATMVNGVAAGRRSGYFYYGGNGHLGLNANAAQLFAAQLAWTASQAPSVGYSRDGVDRIVQRSANGVVTGRYSYTASGDTADLTLNTSGTVVESTLGAPGGVLVTDRGVSGQVWSYPNLSGHVVFVTDDVGAKQGPTRTYDPFGQPLTVAAELDNSAGEFDYGWHGEAQRPLEHQSGAIPVIEMGARPYDPVLGRFLTVDPVEGGSCNDYDYTCAEPINNDDLDGKVCWSCLGRNLKNAGKAVGRTAWKYKWDIGLTAVSFTGVGSAVWAYRAYRIVRVARAAKSMSGGIRSTAATSRLAGRMWVGRGSRAFTGGRISSNGLRQYRYPAYKAKSGHWQANFESRLQPRGKWVNNYHVDIRRRR